MRNIQEFICEAKSSAQDMFNICMEIENNGDIYKSQLRPLSKSCIKKLDTNFDVNTLETSSSVDKLITAAKKNLNVRIDAESRKTLRKYVTAIVLKIMQGDVDLPKEVEDYMIEWDFYSGENKLGW